MNSTELHDLFRSDVVDIEKPYLWSSSEVYGYIDEVQMMFCRFSVGIPDVSTDAVVRVPITTGEKFSPLHPSILYIRKVTLASTDREIELRNLLDSSAPANDYGMVYAAQRENDPGPIRLMVIGEEYNKCRWASVPEADDEALLSVYRLPLNAITGPNQELEVRREHHRSLMYGVKFLAYSKQDAETFDRAKAKENEDRFLAYCEQAKAEWERYKHKPRSVKFGGIGGIGDYGPTSLRRTW
jgi:hypothetical protein